MLVSLLVGGFCVGLTVEDHLLPRLELLEDVQHISVHRVVLLRWAHKGAILEAIVLEQALILFSDAESKQTSLVLELKTGLGSAILHEAQDLHHQGRVLDDTAIATNGLV